jgi:SAM-dependent methyltransferase
VAIRRLIEHLNEEIAKPDPWQMERSPFEQRRHQMLDSMLDGRGPFEKGLEIGCAAGLFTARLAPRCAALHVVDVMPQAIERCRARLGAAPAVRYTVADVSEPFDTGETYDLVVVAEVVYYLGLSRSVVNRAIGGVAALVSEGGTLLFGSATDAVVRGWGLTCGAETAMREFSRTLTLVESRLCEGEAPAERAVIARFVRAAR